MSSSFVTLFRHARHPFKIFPPDLGALRQENFALQCRALGLLPLRYAAGLTPMYFAAQLRAATGLRPHEYLLRRRIERAQDMHLGTGMSLVDVALSVGFQTQAHFTSVLKRYAGQPPRAWRESHGVSVNPTALRDGNFAAGRQCRDNAPFCGQAVHGGSSARTPRTRLRR
jgi:AraC-like DNA-binding protein